LHKVLGSADIIGSPLSLVNYLGIGIYDFIYKPYQGASKDFYHFAEGLFEGSTSLLKNSFFGVFNTTTKITGTMGKGIATLSRDREYLKERELLSREKPRHAAEGFAHGVRDLSVGVFKGFFGFFYDPIKGTVDDGAIGLLSGLLRGTLGLVVKPVVGSLDFFTKTSEGVRNTFIRREEAERGRLPRYFGPDKLLQVYDLEKARGQEYLQVIEEGKYRNEWYLFHLNVERRVVLVSNFRVLYIHQEEKQEEWNVPVRDIKSLAMSNEERGVIISLAHHQASSMFDEPTTRRLIYVKQHELENVYNKLLRVLKALKHPSIEH